MCPVCGETLEKEEGEVALRCTNSECPAQIYRSITHFVSRDCMDISGMGDSIVDKLIEKDLLKDVADIYYLTYADFLSLDKIKDLSANNLLTAIENSKSNTLDKLLFGLGIRHVGNKASKILAKNFEDIHAIENATLDELNSLEDFGAIMAQSVFEFFAKDETHKIIEKLEAAGVNMKGIKEEKKSQVFENMTICVTGSFDNYSRNDVTRIIEENSGKASSSVSKKTTFLVAGENAGSKLTKAQELGIEIKTIEEFISMVEEGKKE